MKLSAISPFLSQSEAAIISTIAEKVMIQAEVALQRARHGNEPGDTIAQVADAQDAAYTLKCIADQSILSNDGELYMWLNKVRNSKELADWIDFDALPKYSWKPHQAAIPAVDSAD